MVSNGFGIIFPIHQADLNQNAYSFERFNLRDDPKEQHDLYDRMPSKAAELKRLLGRFVDVVLVSRPPDADEQRYFRGI